MSGLREGSRLVGLVAVVAAGYVLGSLLSGGGVDWFGLGVVVTGAAMVLALLWYVSEEFAAEET
ncbi:MULTISPECIES: hypothetical protein [Halostella]|uniref:hypothetical protein n=1 Tax=Halostella TaxID=1843185 RepID=UPI0010809DC0|nr:MULTISPECIES: hypothetical protein [Halostella]